MDERISRRDRKRHEQEQQKKKKGKLKTILISLLSFLLFSTVVFAGYTLYNFTT